MLGQATYPQDHEKDDEPSIHVKPRRRARRLKIGGGLPRHRVCPRSMHHKIYSDNVQYQWRSRSPQFVVADTTRSGSGSSRQCTWPAEHSGDRTWRRICHKTSSGVHEVAAGARSRRRSRSCRSDWRVSPLHRRRPSRSQHLQHLLQRPRPRFETSAEQPEFVGRAHGGTRAPRPSARPRQVVFQSQ